MHIDTPWSAEAPTARWDFEAAPDTPLPAELGYEAALPGLQEFSAPTWRDGVRVDGAAR